MNKEKQIEETQNCNNCVHEKVCVIRAFPSAFENTHWEKEPCDHFVARSDATPKAEVANEIIEEIENISIKFPITVERVIYTLQTKLAELRKKYTAATDTNVGGTDGEG